jgi:hypothetical protein
MRDKLARTLFMVFLAAMAATLALSVLHWMKYDVGLSRVLALCLWFAMALAICVLQPPPRVTDFLKRLRHQFGRHHAEEDGLLTQHLLNVFAALSLVLLLVIGQSSATLMSYNHGEFYTLGGWRSPALRWLVWRAHPVELTVQVTVLLALAACPLLWLVALVRRQLTRRRRLRSGHCPWCGYDLRASPDRCTECGTPVDEQLVQSMTPFPRVIAGFQRMKHACAKRTKSIAHWLTTMPECELDANRLRRRDRRKGQQHPSEAP